MINKQWCKARTGILFQTKLIVFVLCISFPSHFYLECYTVVGDIRFGRHRIPFCALLTHFGRFLDNYLAFLLFRLYNGLFLWCSHLLRTLLFPPLSLFASLPSSHPAYRKFPAERWGNQDDMLQGTQY